MVSRSSLALVGAAWLCLAVVGVAADDWSQWRGPNRDGVAAGFVPRKHWPKELDQTWQVEVGLGHASPVASGDRVFQLAREDEQEVVFALSLADGKTNWRHSYAAPYEVNPQAAGHGKGPKSTPLVADGRLFTLGISGILSCWEAESGTLKWRKEFAKQFKHTSPLYGTATSPLLDQGHLIVHLGGPDQGAVVALDVATGETVWTWDGDGPAYASPIIVELSGTRQIIAQTQELCVGLKADDGKLLWKIPYKTDYDQNSVTPIVYEQSVILSGYNRGIDRYRIEHDGDEWRTDKIWENKEVSLYMSSPVAAGQRLFGFSHRQKGQLFAIDVTSGQILWTSDGRLGDNAALVRTGDVVWALTTQGELILFQDSDKEFTELARYKVAETATWAHPLVIAGSVVIKDESHLTRWKFPTNGAPPAASSRPSGQRPSAG